MAQNAHVPVHLPEVPRRHERHVNREAGVPVVRAMTPSDMWKQLVERHPVLATPDGIIKLRASGLRNLIEQAYDEGWKGGASANGESFFTKYSESAKRRTTMKDITYRLLTPGELTDPAQGDEFWDGYTWHPTTRAGHLIHEGLVGAYRRPLNQ